MRRVLAVALIVLAAVLLVPMTPALAQGIEEPLIEKAEEKKEAAEDDPAAYLQDQATEERLAEDANWTIAYGCYAGYIATDEAGLPPPDLEPCDDFEEALGIAEEQEEAEEATAEAEELEAAVTTEAEALAEDAGATAGRIVEDPASAPDEALGLVDRTVRAVQRIHDAIAAFVADTIGGLTTGIGILSKGAGAVVAAPVFGSLWLADGAIVLTTRAVEGMAAIAAATGDAIDSAVAGIGEVTGTTFDAVRDTLRELFGDANETASSAEDAARPGTDQLRHTSEGLLDGAGRLVDTTTRPVA